MSDVPPAPRAGLGGWLVRTLPALLPAWLPQQRWFGGKSRRLAAADVEDVMWLDGAGSAALVIVVVRYADGEHETDRYAFIATAAVEDIVDSTATADALHPLLRALADGKPLEAQSGGSLLFGDATPALQRLTQDTSAPFNVRPIGHEQSNTSARINSTHVFKLIRRLREGEHPQIEIGRFLRRTGFRAVPPLEGSITYRSADDHQYAVGVVEGWVDNSGDGWQYFIARLGAAATTGSGADGLTADCRQLGTTTADLHLALASDPRDAAFAPEPVTAGHLAAWRDAVLAQADRALTEIDRVGGGWPEPLRSRGAALLAGRGTTGQYVANLGGQIDDDEFRLIRIHGDFHLGQTLKSADGFTLIDFEGEPLKPIAERRMKHCALKDVAGMLRSFDYAAADVRARHPAAPAAVLDTASLRQAFLDSYVVRSRDHAATFLPVSATAITALVALFELEKALYELDYEINNRPEWVHIPLAAVTRLLGIAE